MTINVKTMEWPVDVKLILQYLQPQTQGYTFGDRARSLQLPESVHRLELSPEDDPTTRRFASRHARTLDWLVATDILQLVPDPTAVLDIWRWSVKPGGKVIVTVPPVSTEMEETDASLLQLVHRTSAKSVWVNRQHALGDGTRITNFSVYSFRQWARWAAEELNLALTYTAPHVAVFRRFDDA